MLLHHARNIIFFFFFFPPSWNHFFKKGLRNRRLFRHRPNVHPHCLQIVSAAAATESCVALVMYCTVPDFSATWVSLRLHICTLCLCVTSEAEGNATEIITAHISAFLWQQPQRVLNHHTAINHVGFFLCRYYVFEPYVKEVTHLFTTLWECDIYRDTLF